MMFVSTVNLFLRVTKMRITEFFGMSRVKRQNEMDDTKILSNQQESSLCLYYSSFLILPRGVSTVQPPIVYETWLPN